MSIIKLDTIDSTNSFLRHLNQKATVEDYTVAVAKFQSNGRGQMGTIWNAEYGKNLTFSVFKNLSGLKIEHSFFVSMITALAILRTLQSFSIPKLSIKWPNDILSENTKICGILIENVIKYNRLESCIIGIGLNVNQTYFKDLPKASSLKSITGITYNLDELLQNIIDNMKLEVSRLRIGGKQALKRDYESYLFRNKKPSTFKDEEGVLFTGIIQSVSNSGKLKVLLEDDVVKTFDFKEISLLF